MVGRCENPNRPDFKRYGGRGISVDPRWRNSFAAFRRDMGPRPSPKHSIDRVCNEGPYVWWNCRWATTVEQNRNQRSTKLTLAKVAEIRALKGRVPQVEIARQFGICKSSVSMIIGRLSWQEPSERAAA